MTTQHQKQSPRIVVTGHVDHGKSTVIGRLLHDTGSLPDGKAEEVQKLSSARGLDHIEWSYVLDAFKAERDQAITIDTTQITLKSGERRFTLIDAPGHREFLKNMLSGAAQAEAAILVIDASEGLGETTRTHAVLLDLLGLRDVTVVINKMDLMDYNQARFEELSAQILSFMTMLGVPVKHVVPAAARGGDMLVQRGENMDWYDGPSLMDIISDASLRDIDHAARPFRLPVQDVYRKDDQRILAGRIESGRVKVGDMVLASAQNEAAQVIAIENWPDESDCASAGQCTGLILDRKLFVERGSIICDPHHAPKLLHRFAMKLFWLDAAPLKEGARLTLRYGHDEAQVQLRSIDSIMDLSYPEAAADTIPSGKGRAVQRYELARVTLRSKKLLSLDSYASDPVMGRAVLCDDTGRIVAGGRVDVDQFPDERKSVGAPKSQNITRVAHLLTPEERQKQTGHKNGVFWFTGLSGAGKSTLAMLVERALFDAGMQTYVLDGDNIRYGLNADLGFSPEDRVENIRRVGEVASLMANAGSVVMTSFISPYRADRDRARACCKTQFHEIYIKADLQTCESRDPKGLYKKARAGEIREFTGIDAPYEAPVKPDLIVDTAAHDIDDSVRLILEYIQSHVR